MRIAITGALGFIGTEVASLMDGTDDEVLLVDFWEDLIARYEKDRLPIIDRVYRNMHIAAEVMDPWSFIESLRSLAPDAIIHLGAIVDTMDLGSHALFNNNIRYVRSLVDAANTGRLTDNIPGIVFASSAATYGADFAYPSNPYGMTKSRGERDVSSSRGQYANLRFFNVFGSLEHHKGRMASVPFKLAQSYRSGDRFDMHSLSASRDFVPVGTVAQHVVSLARSMAAATPDTAIRATYDVGTATSTTFADLDSFVMQATGNVVSCVREVPIPPEIAGRFQPFTCAGMGPNPVPVLGKDDQGTRDGIEEHYGRR
jgi:ADP-L-glycero-D-manno-heptose 6-epimerase